ncbi:MAG: TetR family transcriptional regulator [Cyanobacteria bacterium P01_A01_bin.84]
MSSQRKSTKDRLIKAALDLFAQKGVRETTTKAVAERAQVNEVTLFRHFGNKHGLILAVMEDAAVFAQLGKAWIEQVESKDNIAEALQGYAQDSLQALEQVPELVRSVVGEAGQYPYENRLALGQGLTEANRYVAQYLAKTIEDKGYSIHFPHDKLASLLNGLLLGYFIIKSTSEGDALWEGQEDFLESVVQLFLRGAISSPNQISIEENTDTNGIYSNIVKDLPGNLVRSLFKRAKKLGKQEYALTYVLFGAGLSAEEILRLERSHSINESQNHILQINHGVVRQVPLNNWIMGFRYGTSLNNPLTAWLKSRRDEEAAIFINQEKKPISETELEDFWKIISEGLLTPQGETPIIEQAKHTWCVEMLMKGVDLENLSILSGISVQNLQPFIFTTKNKTAIEQAHNLDQKPE